MNAWQDRADSPHRTDVDGTTGWARTALCMTATVTVALLWAGAAQARAGGFDSYLDGESAEEVIGTERSVLSPIGAAEGGEIGLSPIDEDGSGMVLGDGGYDSTATLGDPATIYPGAEPGMIPYFGGTDGGFGAWGSPAPVGGGLFLPVDQRWIVQTDALFLWQGNIGSRPLYTNDLSTIGTPPVGVTALDINQTANRAAAGPRVGVILNLDNIYSVEGNYFNVRPFDGEQSTPHTDASYRMNNLAGLGFSGVSWAQATTNAAIQSAELNWRRRTCGPVTWLAGFRWVEWNQGLTLTDTYTTTVPTPVTNYEHISTTTVNDLYGGQAGADVMLWNNSGPIRFNAVGKAGVFYNTAGATLSGFSGTNLGPVVTSAQQTAFFGELGVFGTWQMTSWLAWRTGYNFFWLSGVAVPVDQLSATTLDPPAMHPQINSQGSVFLNGLQFGLESRW